MISFGRSVLSIISIPFWWGLAASVSLCIAVGMSPCPSLWIAIAVLAGVASIVHGLYLFLDFAEFVSDLGSDVIVCGIFPLGVLCP